jgi:hypothetical protein
MDRFGIIAQLVTAEEQANADYIAGNADRDTWTKNLQDIDDKLSILGLRLAFRPWEAAAAAAARF